MIKIELTKEQTEAYKVVKWLTDPMGMRGSGRTQLLAIAYVEHSINYQMPVMVINHGNFHPMANKELVGRIASLVNKMEEYELVIHDRHYHPTIQVKRKLKYETPHKRVQRI